MFFETLKLGLSNRTAALRSVLCLLALLAGACATASPAGANLRPAVAVAGKISAPVDVRYQLTGAVESNQPVVVSLVLTPRVTGTRLTAELADSATLQLAKQTLVFASAKTTAGTALRRSFSITPGSITPGTTPATELLVLVSIDVDGARYASYFQLPLSDQPSAKTERTKKTGPRPLQ